MRREFLETTCQATIVGEYVTSKLLQVCDYLSRDPFTKKVATLPGHVQSMEDLYKPIEATLQLLNFTNGQTRDEV